MIPVYEDELDEYITLFKIYNNERWFYFADTFELVRDAETVLIFYVPIKDFFVVSNHLYILSSEGIHYLNLNKKLDIDLEDTLILRNKRVDNLLVLDNHDLVFNIHKRLIFAEFKFRKIKIKKPLITQSKDLLLINKIVQFELIDSIIWSSYLNKVLISSDHTVMTVTKKPLFEVTDRAETAIMINNYYVYSGNNSIRIVRKDKYTWSSEYEIELHKGYVILNFTSEYDFLYILAINYQNMNCRIYKLKMKNLYL